MVETNSCGKIVVSLKQMQIMAQIISKERLNVLNLTFCHRIKNGKNSFLPFSLHVADIQIHHYIASENQLRALVRQYGSPDETIRQMPSIRLQLNDGTLYEVTGRIESISGIINSQTGTASIRSVFPNEKRILFSGGIGNVLIPHVETNAIVIPQAVTYELQDKIFVYKVVEGKAVSVPIMVERLDNGMEYIVRSGLQAGDVIVSEGVGLLQDGMEIAVKAADHKERKE